jgi:hypothetical protein
MNTVGVKEIEKWYTVEENPQNHPSTFALIKKKPCPLNSEKVFERLNNSQCNLTESREQQCKKLDSGCPNPISSGCFHTAVVFDAGGNVLKLYL